jgi:hypothetical protein
MDDPDIDLDEQFLAELRARAPAKHKKAAAFVKVPLDLAVSAAKATDGERLLVWLLILHRCWKERKRTVTVTNVLCAKYGIDRRVKNRALRQLETAGLIIVEWRARRNPIVTRFL